VIGTVRDYVIPAAFSLLPGEMGSPGAAQMLLAIGLQESRFAHRRQIGGPARGYWQFEAGGGTRGVLSHQASSVLAVAMLRRLGYSPDLGFAGVHAVLEHNDILACVFARLLLWTLPVPLPAPDAGDEGWRQYMAAWRPGKPHPETWAMHWIQAARGRTDAERLA
jgi:hypothetical protein